MSEIVKEAVDIYVLEKRLTARIDELKAMRDALIADANQKIAQINAAIGELEALLNPPVDPPKEGEPDG